MSRYQRSIITAYYGDNDTLYKLVELQLSLIHDKLQLSLIPFLARHGSHRHVAGVPFREQQHKLWRRRARCRGHVLLASWILPPGDCILCSRLQGRHGQFRRWGPEDGVAFTVWSYAFGGLSRRQNGVEGGRASSGHTRSSANSRVPQTLGHRYKR